MKINTVYQSVEELDLPDDKDHHILKDEIITLIGKAAGLINTKFRRVVVLVEEVNRKTKQTT